MSNADQIAYAKKLLVKECGAGEITVSVVRGNKKNLTVVCHEAGPAYLFAGVLI